jgi:hypothetical protein
VGHPVVTHFCPATVIFFSKLRNFFLTVLIAFIVQNGLVTDIHMVTDNISIP